MKITLSPLLATISGKVGSTVYAPQGNYGSYHTRKVTKHKKKDTEPPNLCACWAFQFCDLIYQGFTPEQKAAWRDALKKNGMSAYDLWMKECLPLVNDGQNPPDNPSVSGGYTGNDAAPGTQNPLPDDSPCLPPPEPEPPLGDDCPFCVDTPALQYSCVVSGLVGEPAVFNRTYIVTQTGGVPCLWHVMIDPNDFYLSREAPQHWDFLIEGAAPFGNARFILDTASPNCLDPCTLSWLMGSPPWGDQSAARVAVIPSAPPD